MGADNLSLKSSGDRSDNSEGLILKWENIDEGDEPPSFVARVVPTYRCAISQQQTMLVVGYLLFVYI